MSSKNHHEVEQATTRNENNAMSDNPREGRRLTDNPKANEPTAAEKKPPHDRQDLAAIEEFGHEGVGVAPKE